MRCVFPRQYGMIVAELRRSCYCTSGLRVEPESCGGREPRQGSVAKVRVCGFVWVRPFVVVRRACESSHVMVVTHRVSKEVREASLKSLAKVTEEVSFVEAKARTPERPRHVMCVFSCVPLCTGKTARALHSQRRRRRVEGRQGCVRALDGDVGNFFAIFPAVSQAFPRMNRTV